MAVGHFDALNLALLYQYFFDACIGKDFTAGFLNFRNNVIGDLPTSALRVKTTVQIVPGYHRVHHKC